MKIENPGNMDREYNIQFWWNLADIPDDIGFPPTG